MCDKDNNNSETQHITIEQDILKKVDNGMELERDHLGQMIIDKLDDQPDRIIQIDAATGQELTATQLKKRIIQCSLWMAKQRIKPGDIVVLCTNNNFENCIPVLATFLLGATFNSWSDDNSLEFYRQSMQLFQPRIIFCSKSIISILSKAAELENIHTIFITFGQDHYRHSLNNILELQTDEEITKFQPVKLENPQKFLAYIGMSSGTTGYPKGIMHSYEMITRNFATQNPDTKEVRTLSYSTPFWNTWFCSILQCVLNNITRIVHDKFDAEETCRVIEKYKVNKFITLPIGVNHLVKSRVLKKYSLESLKEVLIIGMIANWKIFQELRRNLSKAKILQTFGMCEILGGVTAPNPNTQCAHSIGFIKPHIQAKVVDLATGKALGPNKPGELHLKTPILAMGYYKNPEKTKEAFDDKGWYHTGDIVYYNENGEWIYVERISEIIRYRGHQIFPTDIEELLLNHPFVMGASVVSIPCEIDGEQPIAFVKLLAGQKVSEKEIENLSPTIEGEHILHGKVIFLDEIPKTASGKYARPELKRLAGQLMNLK